MDWIGRTILVCVILSYLKLPTICKFASAKTQRLQNPEMEMIWENKKTWQQEKLEDVKTPQDSQREEHLLPLSLSISVLQSKQGTLSFLHCCTTWNMCQLTTQANEFLIRHFLLHRGKLDIFSILSKMSNRSKTGLFNTRNFHYKNKKKISYCQNWKCWNQKNHSCW